MRTVVTFESDHFNLTESRGYFINPGCFGDDVAKWLIEKFKTIGVEVDEEPGQEDFGWYFTYSVENAPYCIVIGPYEEEKWFLVVERNCGLLRSLLGQRHKNISPAAVDVVRKLLVGEPIITNIKWYHWKQFERGSLIDGDEDPYVP